MNRTILELKVNNHSGVMSHVCGLFTRRAYNMEGIVCLPIEETSYSRIWILVCEDNRLSQVIKQTEKLEDVIDVKYHVEIDYQVFAELKTVFSL